MPGEAHYLSGVVGLCQHIWSALGFQQLVFPQIGEKRDVQGKRWPDEAVEKGFEKGFALIPCPDVAPAESLTGRDCGCDSGKDMPRSLVGER